MVVATKATTKVNLLNSNTPSSQLGTVNKLWSSLLNNKRTHA